MQSQPFDPKQGRSPKSGLNSAPTTQNNSGPEQVVRQKRKKSVPREMSSRHKTLNSDSEQSDDEPNTVSPMAPIFKIMPPVAPTFYSQQSDTQRPRFDSEASLSEVAPDVQVKRGRGRPRKYPKEVEPKQPKRPRGRPRKNVGENERLKVLCTAFIQHSGMLADRVNQQNMPEVVSQLRKGIALAQYIQENADADGNLGNSQIEVVEAKAKNNVS